jgi:outer membrane lipoprotein LolB
MILWPRSLQYLTYLSWLIMCVGIVGCQTAPQRPADQQHQNQVEAFQHWSAEGKIAIQYGGDRESASFQWTQSQKDYAIFLHGPFGQGGTWLRKDKQGVSLESSKGKKRASTPEALMQKELGWQVPVSNMQFWMRGLAAKKPKPKHMLRDHNNNLSQLIQQGWQVDYQNFASFNGYWLPTKLTAKRGQITIKMVIKDWQMAI